MNVPIIERTTFLSNYCMECKKQIVCCAYEKIGKLPEYIKINHCSQFDKIDGD